MELSNEQKIKMNKNIENLKQKKSIIEQLRIQYNNGQEDGSNLNQKIREFKLDVTSIQTEFGIKVSFPDELLNPVEIKSNNSQVTVEKPFFTRSETKTEEKEFKEVPIDDIPCEESKAEPVQETNIGEIKETQTQNNEPKHASKNVREEIEDNTFKEIAESIAEQQKNQNKENHKQSKQKHKEAKNESKQMSDVEYELNKAIIDKGRYVKALRYASRIIAKDHTEKNAEGWFKELISRTFVDDYEKEDENV